VIGGPKFHSSVAVLQIMGVGVIGTFLVAIWAFALLTLRLYRDLIIANGVIVALAVVLCVVLIPSHQAHGGAIVTATLELALASAYFGILSYRRPELRPSFRKVPRVAIAVAIAFVAAALLPVHPVIAVIVGAIVMLAALLALGALPEEFLQALRQRSSG
jgi:O-antigen/teichoic acid export membrane protein